MSEVPKRSKYNPNLILYVGKWCRGYEGKALEQIPLSYFRGYKILRGLLPKRDSEGKIKKGPPKYQYDQLSWIIDAYGDFDVNIKCEGRGNECREEASVIAVPWNIRDRHTQEGGPDVKKQFNVPQSSFLCPGCYRNFSEERIPTGYAGEKGVQNFPINFTIFGRNDYGDDWSLDRTELHGFLRNVAHILTTQTADETIERKQIDEAGDRRFTIKDKDAKLIVNRLFRTGVTPSIFSKEPEYEEEFLSYRDFGRYARNIEE